MRIQREYIYHKKMEKTWTVVRFEDENVVEAVPTSWITNGRCYWPPYTTEKTLKAIKDHVDFNSSWASYEVYVFKNSTSGKKRYIIIIQLSIIQHIPYSI